MNIMVTLDSNIETACDVARAGRLRIDWNVPGVLVEALTEITLEFPDRFTEDDAAASVSFEHWDRANADNGFSIRSRNGGYLIKYSDTVSALRAVSFLFSEREWDEKTVWEESTPFQTRGVMLDASRNAVPKVDTVKYFVRRMAMMGLNRLLLYCEDTYEIEGEPFFGYFRGRYSAAELREIDDYAYQFGIEVVLCIQTLGHLENVLQWPRYAQCRDTEHVLMVDSAESYELIGKMLDVAGTCLRSRTVHIGLDEAHGLGSGGFRMKFGIASSVEIFMRHLERVTNLCRERGLEPLIWSDMFFRLGSEGDDYYDLKSTIPRDVSDRIPADIRLVYWDYYHKDQDFYSDWIDRHSQLGPPPVFACGIWSWNRFYTALPYTLNTIRPGMEAARAKGLRDVMTTSWGDDGSECDILSTLPAIQFFAEKCYGGDEPEAARNFRGSTDADWSLWLLASQLDTPGGQELDSHFDNHAKWMLWHDPLLGFLNAHMAEASAGTYADLALAIESADAGPREQARLHLPRLIAETLAKKCLIHRDLRRAYKNRDLVRLRWMVEAEIPGLVEGIETLRRAHRDLWMALYKPFGWEVLDVRYGGLKARFETLSSVVIGICRDPDAPVAELDIEPLLLSDDGDSEYSHVFRWKRAYTPSVQ